VAAVVAVVAARAGMAIAVIAAAAGIGATAQSRADVDPLH
jgi:hypothetical protein